MTEITPSEDVTPERIVVTEDVEQFIALWWSRHDECWLAREYPYGSAQEAMDDTLEDHNIHHSQVRVIKVTLPYPVEDEA